ncbi:hypothetical protein L3X38_004300 [Prunus dulcis]|uniref:Tf2-1-like SH3-like domain-containing protein n=1 Tax=Prunus dulcis TaxID=3755 RepID=A0AAD5F325_PRUDU|nr:hypothetical protein L3X38_004300 [Prunus dulcis]
MTVSSSITQEDLMLLQDPLFCALKLEVKNGTRMDYSVRSDRALMVGTRLYVHDDKALKREILEEAHCSAFGMHPDIKAEWKKPSELLQPLPIPEWEYKHITMDFVFKLPRTLNKHDGIWVERMIQTLEDMPRACALQFRGDWDEKLPLMEFAYNNSCQTSIEMSPFDALYGKQCRTPLYEDEVGVVRFGKQGKLSPHNIGPYQIVERVGLVAYRPALPLNLSW